MDRPGIGAELEGIHAVAAAVDAGRVTRITVERSRANRPEIASILEAAAAHGVRVDTVDDVRDLARTHAPQGIVATARTVETFSLKDAVARSAPAALLVVDHIQDGRNIGAAARSALAAGMTGIVVSTRRSAPIGAAAFKAAAGALEHLPIIEVSSIADAARTLGKLGVWTVGLDAHGGSSLFGLEILQQPVAVVVGTEGDGLSRLVAERCDVVAHIPMAPKSESLNASVAAALACFEVARMRASVT